MALVQATLETGLLNLTPTDQEATAITRLVDAYGTYASTATGAGVLITAAGVTLGKNAMASVLVGMSASNAGRAKIPAACLAFWTAVCASFVVSFPGSIAATPPPHVTLPTSFPTTIDANMSGSLSLADSASAIAGVIHADALVGGTVTLPGTPPIVGPIL